MLARRLVGEQYVLAKARKRMQLVIMIVWAPEETQVYVLVDRNDPQKGVHCRHDSR